MKKVTGISLLIPLIVTILLSTISCGQETGSTITQAEYDAVKAQLSAAEARIVELETAEKMPTVTPGEQVPDGEITSLKAEIAGLESEIEELNQQKDSLTQEKSALEDKYTELETNYKDLEKTLAILTQPKIITEEQVENEIFNLINQERVNAGVPILEYGRQLYNQAKQNSCANAASGKLELDPDVLYQEVFRAASYDSVENIARGALLTWKLDEYGFEHGVLLEGNKYGAVGVCKSGELVYITLLAAFFP